MMMKISLITVVYNGEAFLKDCFASVFTQTYRDIEYIVIDGGSTDKTLAIIEEHKSNIDYFISEKDKGLYHAINKGIAAATGDVVGILNADDMLAQSNVIEQVANQFLNRPEIEVVYGDLHYIHPLSGKIIRTWESKQAVKKDIENGWMPAHPTLYLKKYLFERVGNYALDLGTAADYDFILRLLYKHQAIALYLPILMVKMRTGGLSNRSFSSLVNAFINDYKALTRNHLPKPVLALLLKKLSKLKQF